MKPIRIFLIFFLALFSSCQSVSRVMLDIKHPAEVDFLTNLTDLAIVDNSAIQPDDVGGSFLDFNGNKTPLLLTYDKLSEIYTSVLAEDMISKNPGLPITLYTDSLQAAGEYEGQRPIAKEKLNQIYKKTGMSNILELNTLYTQAELTETVFENGVLINLVFKINTSALFRLYSKSKSDFEMFHFTDTLSWSVLGFNAESALKMLPPFSICLKDGTYYAAIKASKRFFPYTDQEHRFIQKGFGPAMTDALIYQKKGKWFEAASLWEYVYEYSENTANRAKAAANMAVYAEINDNFEHALSWIEKSLQLLSKSKNISFKVYLNDYRAKLQRRKQEIAIFEHLDYN